MFISKKNYQKAIDEAVTKAIEKERKEEYERETLNHIYRRLDEFEIALNRHIRDDANSNCGCTCKETVNPM